MWAKRVEMHKSQTVMLKGLKEKRDFDIISRNARGKPKSDKNKTNQKKNMLRQMQALWIHTPGETVLSIRQSMWKIQKDESL